MFGIFDIYLLEAMINGVLLGGVLALLALGWDNVVYGTLLVVFIIFLPQGLVGSLLPRRGRA
jgi:branched-chain amino acid transport system permease protein